MLSSHESVSFLQSLIRGSLCAHSLKAAMVVQAADNRPRHTPNTRYSHSSATHPPNIVALLSFNRGMQVDGVPGPASALVSVLNDKFVSRSEPNISTNYPKGNRKLSFTELCVYNNSDT